MAPMVWGDTVDMQLDVINFDEIARLATSMGNFDITSGPQPASQVKLDELLNLATSGDTLFDSTELSGDNGVGMGPQPASQEEVNLEELLSLATSGDTLFAFDSTKLSGDNGVGVGLQPASQEVNLDELLSLATSGDTLFDSTKLGGDNGVGVGPQPGSPQPQLLPQEYLSNLDDQPASPEFLFLQPAVSEPVMQQTPSLVPDPIQAADTKPASPEILFLQSTIPGPFLQQALSPAAISQQTFSPATISHQALSPAADPQQTVSLEPCSIQQLDLPQLCASYTSLAASPANSCVSSSSSMWHQKQDEGVTMAAPQQAVDAPKKRGRKGKDPNGIGLSRRQSRRPKVYEMEPFPDEEMEKKRKNAVTAKKHRDMQKAKKQQLSEDLAQATAERDHLLMMVNQFKQREQQLLQVLNMHNVKIDELPHALNGL